MNLRLHNVIVAILSIAFLVVVQLFSSPVPVFRYLVPAFSVYLAVLSGYAYWHLWRSHQFSFWLWLRLPLFLLAWFGFFFLIPTALLQGVFLLVSLVLLYFFQLTMGKLGEQVLFSQTLLTAFAFCMFIMAFSSYFPVSSLLYFVLLVVFVSLLVRASFELTPATRQGKFLGAALVTALLAELFWSLSFLPLHYSALGLILFNFFYFIWSLYYYYLFKLLTLQKIELQLGLLALFTILILFATRFAPLTT
jgi:hypothetical protein